MTFKKFVEQLQGDADVTAFKKWLAQNPKFPNSNSPDAHIVFINFGGGALEPYERLGYKKAMMVYFELDGNKLKKAFRDNKNLFLTTINKI